VNTLDQTIAFLSAVTAQDRRGVDIAALTREVQTVMQRHCLVEKTAERLNLALDTVLRVKREVEENLALVPETLAQGLSLRNLVQASELVLIACINRKETRSAHYRLDYPAADDKNYLYSFVMRRNGDGVAIKARRY